MLILFWTWVSWLLLVAIRRSMLISYRYLRSSFHLFDSLVIVLSFIIDVTAQGLAESIGSLVVVLRLWRLAKISEEIMLGATERMEMLEQHLYDMENENKELRLQLGLRAQDEDADVQG